MSKDNHSSRIPMRGFSSRIPMPGTSATPSSTQSIKMTTPSNDSNQIKTKLARPTDIGGPLSSFVRPTAVTQKITQITKSSLSNLTSRIMTRQFSTSSNHIQKIESSQSNNKENKEVHEIHDDDQMLIDETIDLVGSDDNMHRYASKESIPSTHPPTFDLCRRDGTFIKSPTRGLNATPSIGSVNSLPDAKDKPSNTQRAVSKSRDSLNSIISNQTRIARLRKSGNDLLGSSLSLTKSPIWGSEDILNVSPMDNENVSFVNSQLACGPFFNHHLPTDASARILCLNDETTTQTAMDVDECDAQGSTVIMRINEARVDAQKRFSFGLDITECTLDCSIELCDTSMSSTMQKASPTDKQGSFDVDESLGILTPDQMKEFLDSTNTNHTNNLELPLIPGHKLSHQCRIDQTPSPEELPLDPVGVKMEEVIQQSVQNHQVASTTTSMHQEVSQAESDPKTEMTKSVTSKVSASIITSITSITSLDTGYIGDGEMSRPASRGAVDQSPSKVPRNAPAPMNNNWNQAQPAAAPVHRQRQDPMTDSDFFTESDADDIFHQRENQRRAQVIDGHLYGPMLQGANVIFQQQPQQNESDSCMESSGVFTDVENRGDDDLLNRIAENRENFHHQQQQQQLANDMSPDLSSDTITSNGTAYSQKKLNVTTTTTTPSPTQHIDRPREFITETSSSLCSAMDERAVSAETINLINDTSSFGSTKSCCMTNDDCDKQMIISDGSSGKKVTASASKKLSGTNRKTFKNEANFGLKKHEMSSRGAGIKMNSNHNNDKTVTKKCMNGKWEPVMNKIAENKNSKKKFDNVKSKVTSGAVKRTTSNIKTPPSDDHSIVSTESTGAIAKRNSCASYKNNGSNNSSLKESPTGSKRGRTHSKDSHQSSQSDLSMNGAAASPKIIKSSSTRAAKKRDVRTISSSPSDLGPPSKTSNGTNQTQRNSARTLPNSQKRAQTQQIIQPPVVNQIAELKGSPPAKKIVPRRLINASPLPQDKTPLKDHNRLSQQQSPVNGSPRSSIRSNHSSKAATPSPNNNRNGIIESLNISPKSKAKELENNNSSKIVNKNNANVNKMQKEELLQQIIDQQALEKQNQMLELLHANKNVEALGVLVQYLVFNLDAFSCPSLKKSQQKTQKQLLKAHDYIDEMKSSYQCLEEKLHEREDFFSKRELELQELHRCEMAKAKKSLEDLENEKLSKEALITEMKRANEAKLQKLSKDFEEKLKLRENDLMQRIQQLTVTENELRDKVHSSELEYSEKLQLATMKERDLSDKINQLTKVLDDLKIQSDIEKRELEEKLNLSQDELSVLRSSRSSCVNESFQNRTLNTSLQDEVESLRCVLELKQHEISELRKTNCELQRAADDAIAAQIKCSALESRVEDLQVQLHAKNEEEKELLQKLKTLQEQNDQIQKKSSRLSLHNEELQWRLKQNAERYSMTINELSKSYHETSSFMRSSEFDISGRSTNGGSTLEDEDATNSPPASPIIKGVVEKSDSVSWVLEMDDETPEVLANRMVRRAGSFRSSDKCSPSPVPKKQKCQNNSNIQQSASATSIIRQHSEPSPLKTLNGRLRSKSVSASKAIEPTRVKSIPQMVRSMSGNGAVIKNLSETAWKHHNLAMKTSSPNPKKQQHTTLDDELIIDEDFESASSKNEFFLDDSVPVVVNDECESFHRDTAPNFKKSRENRGLITCDTAALSTDIKKHRRPKVSAGEIKFSGSGSNSEEEEDECHSNNTSSASSTVSTPSISSSSSTSSSGNEQPIESIEDALLRWKEHNNTPMEVSWCEEEPRESCV